MEKFSNRKQAGTLVTCVPMCYIYFIYSGCILECRNKPTSHCLTNFYTHGNNLISISVLKILVHIVHFCLARTVKLWCFFTEVSDCELM